MRAFFLNEGSYNGNNAGISFYAPNGDADFISDIYSYQNDAKLGDTGQCMIEYEGEIYVAVYGSNYLAKLNSAGVEQQRLSFVTDPELSAGIRYLAAEDGYIYASFWGGVVAKINAQTLKVESKLTELGDNLEGVAICKDMLYVANSCTPDWSAYHKEVKVIDLNTFTLKETLTVDLNPNTLIEEEDKIFLISWGNYVDVGYSLQMIDPNNNNQVTPLGEITKMGAGNDMLYLTYSSYTNPETKFFSYNIRTGQMDQTSFLKDIPNLCREVRCGRYQSEFSRILQLNPMRRFPIFIFIWGAALLLSACSGRGKALPASTEGDTLSLRYAENLMLVDYPGYTVATLRNPWDTLKTLHTYILVPKSNDLPDNLPAGTVVRTPLTKAVVYSSVHCGLLHELGAGNAIGGVCDLKYIKLPELHKAVNQGRIADCGDGMNPDMERIIDLHPDAILLSPFENSGGYGRVEKLGTPIIECADYMETSALGRAEWMRFYGRLFGTVSQADSLFAHVDSSYNRLKHRAALSSVRLSVVCELKNGSAWYVPGGRSTTGRLLEDAYSDYAFAKDAHSGSVPLPFETVFEKAGDADIWLIKYNRQRDMTYADLQADFVGYTGFKAFKERRVYGCNTGKVAFYEETPFHPDRLLADLIQILHPETDISDGPRYYKELKEN